ncbi:MAG: prephenate dehydrogenase [Methanosarcinales archaeon]|nr:MAG: prephenate dehydrogenase [Methanosarcinales archaeon]
MKILIIGGTGELGQWFTRFFSRLGHEVAVRGRSGRVDIAQRLGVAYAHDQDKAVRESDIVVISVPIDATEATIEEIAPKMVRGSLLMDMTSIKKSPLDAMERLAPEGVEVIGTHPMFGPSIPDIRGQTVMITPSSRCGRWLPYIINLLDGEGANVEVVDAGMHDRVMAVVQGLTHFAYISIGATFQSLDFEVSESRKFMSPVYEIMLDFVGRILGQNPHLYAMIQTNNPAVAEVREAFITECIRLSELVSSSSIDDFYDLMKNAAAHFGDTESALKRSDKLINTKISEIEEMIRSIGREKAVLHLRSGVTHVGTITKVTPRTIIMEKKGRKPVKLKIENIKLLNDSELYDWKLANLRRIKRDISVILPDRADPSVVCNVITEMGGAGVVSADVIDRYEPKQSATFRIKILGDHNPDEVERRIETVLAGIGCVRRG